MTRRNFLLALDQGTSSSRSIVFDPEGRVVGMAQREFRQLYPQPGWVEHDPIEIRDTQFATVREALDRAGITASEVAALGITNQRETTVVWNRRTGQPIHNAIVWQDRRSEPTCAALRAAGHEETIRARTGLIVDAYFSGTKLKWLLDHVPGARAAAARGELAFGTIDTWLMWQLTGGAVHATDVSNASRTMLFDVRANRWSDTLLAMLDVPHEVLPAVHPSRHAFGTCDPAHFGAAIPIGGVAGDQQSALFGQACFKAGLAKNTYGTGCFMLMHTGATFQTSTNGLITTSAAQPTATPEFALEGSVFIGGAVVQWLRDGLGIIRSAPDVEALALSVPDNGGVYLVPAFAGLGAPHWDAYARGTLVGITRGTTAGHVARAALEAIAYQSADLLDAMHKDAGTGLAELRVDGGAAKNDLLMQFQADMVGVPVVRPEVTETTALGAAYLAGLATGFWKSTDETAKQWRAERRFEPKMKRADAEALRARWTRAVERAKGWEAES